MTTTSTGSSLTEIQKWLISRSDQVANMLTIEASEKGYIKDNQRVVCTISLGKVGKELKDERLYQINLNEGDKHEILSLWWKPTYLSIIHSLLEKNPKVDKYPTSEADEWLWSDACQSGINKIFREAKLPWRVIATGKWDDRLVYLATVMASHAAPIGIIRFNPMLESRRIECVTPYHNRRS